MTTAPSTVSAPPSRGRDPRLLVLGAAAITVLLWASAFVGIRIAAVDFGPGSLALGRVAVGTVVLAVLQLTLGRRRRDTPTAPAPATAETPVPAEAPAMAQAPALAPAAAPAPMPTRSLRTAPRWVIIGIVLWGVAWFGLYNLALNAAERHVDAGTAALLVNIAPMITAVLAGLLLKEGFPRRLIVGMAVSLVGVAVVTAATTTGQFDAIGIVLGLAAALLYGGAATVQKRLLAYVPASTMTLLGCVAATVALLPFVPELVRSIEAAPPSSLLAVLYLGVFPTAVAFSTWGYVLSRTSAGRTAATTYAVPALVIALSWLALRETPPLLALAGGALALAGVAIATLRRRRA